MNAGDLTPGNLFYTTDGCDIWKLDGYFTMPSCLLRNIETGEKQTFGMGGLTAESFHPIIMPEIKGKRITNEPNAEAESD